MTTAAGESAIDQTARDIAMGALARIESHEKVCEEIARQAREDRTEIKGMVESLQRGMEILYSRLWQVAVAFMSLIMMALGALIAKAFVFH